MINIAICDDERNVCSHLEKLIESYMKKNYVSIEINIFYSGENLCKFLNSNEHINLIFLDIELPQINGVEVGKYIRNTLENELIDIVYISSKTNYAMELFQCRPIDFIMKPLEYEKIEKVLNVVFKRNGMKSQTFEYQKEGIRYKIPLHQIMYFKSENKKIYIVMCSGEEKVFYGKLNKVMEVVPDTVFLLIHKSFLVNYDYVLEYSHEKVKMINEDEINISKIHRREVKEKLIRHEFGRGD